MECYIKSMYLCVNDMDRAIHFYEDFFEQVFNAGQSPTKSE